MNVGDYVRDITGKIGRIKRKKYNKCHERYLEDLYLVRRTWGFKGYFVKSSPNIIDVIEVGDYVNGKQVIDFMLENGKRKGIIVDADIWGFDEDEIKSIVTKEQFESMEYRIGE